MTPQTPHEILSQALERHRGRIALSCSFGGPGGMVLLDMALRLEPRLPVLCVDTSFLFPQTYALLQAAERHYGIEVRRVRSPLSPEQQAREHGPQLWRRDPDACCQLRKVEPLADALAGYDAWITAVRREQSSTRADIDVLSWDAQFGLLKICPLAAWTEAQVWDYVRLHDVPYNALHDEGYPSIGCTHCTRAVTQNESQRAGRWPGFNKTECGLHRSTNVAKEA
jgi:phosphoadenosine phosphosulfate reductase